MADFNAKINLDADNSKALKKIEQVEKAVNKLDNAVNKVQVKVLGTQQAEQQVNKLYKALERLESSALSRLPQSLQMVIAYLKAANAGMGEFAKRAILASNAVGDIGRVSLAPIVRAQTQAVTKFNDMGGALVRVNRQIVELRNNINSLIGPIEAVSVKFLNPTNFSPKLPGNIGFGGGAGTQYYGGAIGPNPQGLLSGSNQRLLPPGRLSEVDKALQALGLFDAALRKAVTQVDQFGRGGTAQQGPAPAFNLGSIRALEAELRAKQALVNNAKIGTQAFRRYSRELQNTTRQLEKAQSAGKGFFSNLTNPQSKLGSAVIGAGFPLITGGGPGSILGGGLGGLAGGFAGSIGGSAIGQAFDQAAAAVIKTAEATRSTGNAFDFLSEKQLFSSDATRRLAEELAELGEVERLAALATAELVNIIGNKGVQNLQELDSEWQQLLSNVSELGLAIAAFISQYLKPVIELLNNAVGGINARNRFESLREDLRGTEAGKQLEKEITEIRRTRGRGARLGALQTTDQKRLLEQFSSLRPVTAVIPVTDADRDRFAPPKTKTKTGKSDEDRIRERLQLLAIETAAIREQSEIKSLISAARIAEDRALQNELELALKLNQIQERLAQNLVRVTDERVKQAEILKAETQAVAAQREFAEKEAERIAKQTRNYETTLANMNAQIELASAMTVEQEKQAKFELEILKFRERNKQLLADQPELYAKLEASFRKLFELQNQSPLNQYIQQTSKALNDTEAQLVRVAQTVEGQLAAGLANFFNGIVDGSKSAEEAFVEMLDAMGKALVQQGTQMIAQYIAIGIARAFAGMGGGGGGNNFGPTPLTRGIDYSSAFREDGGPVSANRPYIVGEKEPELFVPKTSGTIYNQDQMRSAMATYSEENSVPVQTEPLSISLETTMINNEEYVTTEQFRKGMDESARQGAKLGEQRALNRLRQSRSTRNKLGM